MLWKVKQILLHQWQLVVSHEWGNDWIVIGLNNLMNTWYFEAFQNNFENDGRPINNQSSSMYEYV